MGQVIDWSSRFGFGNPRPTSNIKIICIHVTVNAPGTPCENVAQYQIDSESGSYHELTDSNARTLIENTDDWQTWSSGNYGNNIGLHRSFVMRGTESRDEWLRYDAMLRAGAQRDAAWCRKYGIPAVKLSAADLRAGKKGFCGHLETGQAWGGTDHVDPGAGFPWDYYLKLVNEYLGGKTPAATSSAVPVSKNVDTDRIIKHITDFIVGFTGPIGSDVKDVRQQLTGGRDAGDYRGWPQLGQDAQGRDLTLVDAIAALRRDVASLSSKIEEVANGSARRR